MVYAIQAFVFLGILLMFILLDKRFKVISNFFVRGKSKKLIGITVGTILLTWLLAYLGSIGTLEIRDCVYLFTFLLSVFASITIIANNKPTN